MSDTRPIPFLDNLPPGYAKMSTFVGEGVIPLSCENSTEVAPQCMPHETASAAIANALPANYSPSLIEFLSRTASDLKGKLRVSAAAAMMDWARLTFQDRQTGHVDLQRLVHAITEEAVASVSVSPRLIMPRKDVGVSSLLAPSGVYLTWIQLMEDASHE